MLDSRYEFPDCYQAMKIDVLFCFVLVNKFLYRGLIYFKRNEALLTKNKFYDATVKIILI